jgi:outer membrane protein, heavy metal efflux system
MFRSIMAGLVSALALAGSVDAAPKAPPGATAAELIALARRLSPEVAATVLSADAATARITSAGALPDPIARIEVDNLDQRDTTANGTTYKYTVMQEFPLWGKRDLREDMARLEANAARYRTRNAELELVARVKSVFAARYATYRAIALNQQTLGTVETSAATVRDRYTQGNASQEDALRLEIEAEEFRIEIERLRGQAIKTAAQLNALLNRRPDAPLAEPVGLRRLPDEKKMSVGALIARASKRNPAISEGETKAASAGVARTLAERNRYPDVTLGLSMKQDRGGYAGSGVMGEVRIPLQWRAKEADVAAATAEQSAAELRLVALNAKLRGDLTGMLAEYRATTNTLDLIYHHHLPKSQLVVRSAVAALQGPEGNVLGVLDALRRLRQVQLEALKLEVEQQSSLAEIEKAIGGDL